MTIQSLATEVSREFVKGTRTDGLTEYWLRKENKQDWIQEAIHAAHGDMLPDDWRYEFIVQALNAMSEYDNPDTARDSLELEPYTDMLTAWLASNVNRVGYVDEAVAEFGHTSLNNTYADYKGIIGDIAVGQLFERHEVFDSVRESLEKRLSEMEEVNQ